MKLSVANTLQFLLLVPACESVVFSWLWSVHLTPDSPTSTYNESGSLPTDPVQKYCTKDRQCDRGYCHKHYGTCHKCKSVEQKCRRDHVCCKGFECVFGSCRKVVKVGNYLSRCRKDKDCKKGLCCAKSHGESVCKPMLRRNQICSVLEGGVAYTINHGCPCDDGLVCRIRVRRRGKRVKGTNLPRRKTKIRRCQKMPS